MKVLDMATPPAQLIDSGNISSKTHVPHIKTSERHWGVRFGGLIALKYLIPLNWGILQLENESLFYSILQDSLQDPLDDISGVAAELVRSLTVAIQIKNKIEINYSNHNNLKNSNLRHNIFTDSDDLENSSSDHRKGKRYIVMYDTY